MLQGLALGRSIARIAALVGAAALVALIAAASPASAHPERPTEFPDGSGKVPEIRRSGPARIVCKPDSRKRIMRMRGTKNAKIRRRNLRYLRACRYEHIQQAVDAAQNGDRILLLPGVYREEPSRRVPNPDPKCESMYVEAAANGKPTPNYEYEWNCPNSRQMVAILGDSPDDPDRKCDRKCNLQIQGTGRFANEVRVIGDPTKQNVFKADRADGIVFYNLSAEISDYNNFYVLETDGFRFEKIRSRWSNEYGFLSFVSDNGLYQNLDTSGAGDAGVYPGSGPQRAKCGITLRNVNSHHNLQGNSGSAGDNLCYYDSKFHHNGLGVVVDSFSRGHPGTPQDSSVWKNNLIYSNNQDYFRPELDEYCKKPYTERDPKIVCPAIMVPVGTGLLIAGGNENVVEDNFIFDNWRYGTMLFFVEGAFRGDNGPEQQTDTSHGNRFVGNRMGVRPDGTRDPNGTDNWWDEAGGRNCWERNTGAGGAPSSGNPSSLPECDDPLNSAPRPVNPAKHSFLVPCATWDPYENTDPPGCDWMEVPPEPK